LCLDAEILQLPEVMALVPALSRSTSQPLLQARLLAYAPEQAADLRANPLLHPAVATLLAVGPEVKAKIVSHPARFAALLAKLPLDLPRGGYRLRMLADHA
jgi:hypothetical protein